MLHFKLFTASLVLWTLTILVECRFDYEGGHRYCLRNASGIYFAIDQEELQDLPQALLHRTSNLHDDNKAPIVVECCPQHALADNGQCVPNCATGCPLNAGCARPDTCKCLDEYYEARDAQGGMLCKPKPKCVKRSCEHLTEGWFHCVAQGYCACRSPLSALVMRNATFHCAKANCANGKYENGYCLCDSGYIKNIFSEKCDILDIRQNVAKIAEAPLPFRCAAHQQFRNGVCKCAHGYHRFGLRDIEFHICLPQANVAGAPTKSDLSPDAVENQETLVLPAYAEPYSTFKLSLIGLAAFATVIYLSTRRHYCGKEVKRRELRNVGQYNVFNNF